MTVLEQIDADLDRWNSLATETNLLLRRLVELAEAQLEATSKRKPAAPKTVTKEWLTTSKTG